LKILEFPSPKNNLYQVWLNLACWFWRRRFFKIFSTFLLFRYYLSLERSYPFSLNLNPLHPRMICAKSG
jgi:hypothetical protein